MATTDSTLLQRVLVFMLGALVALSLGQLSACATIRFCPDDLTGQLRPCPR